jgi:hypothetical protein
MTTRISKTSLNGAIAFFIASVPVVQAYPQLHISPTLMAWLSLVAGLGRLYVGLQQQDADTVLAKVPGQAAPMDVPAHPTPDDPAAKPVIPASK